MKWVAVVVVVVVGLIATLPGSSGADNPPPTLPSEALALNTIFRKWKISANNSIARWNLSTDICWGLPLQTGQIFESDDHNPYIVCNCEIDEFCHITKLKVLQLDVYGTIPDELQNLTYLENLQIARNYLYGQLPAFIGNFSRLRYLSVGRNALSGPVPKELGKLKALLSLGIDTCNFSGPLPPELGNLTSLQQMYILSMGVSGEIPKSFAKLKNLQTWWAGDNDFGGKVPEFIGNMTNLQSLKFLGNSFQGPIPSSFANLEHLTLLILSDVSNQSSSLSFVRNMTSLTTLILRNSRISDTLPSDIDKYQSLTLLDLSFNNLTGQLPASLFNLSNLEDLYLGNNNIYGALPDTKNPKLVNIDLSYNNLSGNLPPWQNDEDLQLNLVANNFDESSNGLLRCLQKDVPCYHGSPVYYSFDINCGGEGVTASDGTIYEADNENLAEASYFVKEDYRWAVSSTGKFLDATTPKYTDDSFSRFANTKDSELFRTVRLSPSSLRYYGLALENGSYTVTLEFAETTFPDEFKYVAHGRRIFDIYIQGILMAKDFNIRKEAGGSFKAVIRNYTALVKNNFLEVHLFWAGKGTIAIPNLGHYGPSISAISIRPNFKPTVGNHFSAISIWPNFKTIVGNLLRKFKTALIVGVSVASALTILLIFGIFMWRWKKANIDEEELLGLPIMPNTFTFAELRKATKDFSPTNKLGAGGFGVVFKGKLSDGRVVAVKKLSLASFHGKRQFVTEIAIIYAVQHRNLVKLHGYCYEGDKRLLVYEFLENNSLDYALFGKSHLQLDWPARYNICLNTARGLAYLHEESRLRIIHRDVKASNILLDADLNPKISDFGLAKLYEYGITHLSTRVAGTIGYLAPEYALRGHLTEKVDIFGFGILVLEIITGRPNTGTDSDGEKMYLLDWAWHLREGNRQLEMMDPRLSSYNKEEAIRMIGVAFLCTQTNPVLRPPMSRVIAMLVGDMEISDDISKPAYLADCKNGEAYYYGFTGSIVEASEISSSQYDTHEQAALFPSLSISSHRSEGNTH